MNSLALQYSGGQGWTKQIVQGQRKQGEEDKATPDKEEVQQVPAAATAQDGANNPLHSDTVTTVAGHPTVAVRKQSTQQLKGIIKQQELMLEEERAKTAAAIAGKETQQRRAERWKVTATAHKKQKMEALADVGKISEERDGPY